jgi:hypothetical protein
LPDSLIFDAFGVRRLDFPDAFQKKFLAPFAILILTSQASEKAAVRARQHLRRSYRPQCRWRTCPLFSRVFAIHRMTQHRDVHARRSHAHIAVMWIANGGDGAQTLARVHVSLSGVAVFFIV